jgi:hypothetical protein
MALSAGFHHPGRRVFLGLAWRGLVVRAVGPASMLPLDICGFTDRIIGNCWMWWVNVYTGRGATYPSVARSISRVSVYAVFVAACSFIGTLPSYADDALTNTELGVPQLMCDGDKPSTSGLTVSERRGSLTLWENMISDGNSEFLLIDKDRCYVAFQTSEVVVFRLDTAAAPRLDSFDPQTAFPSALGQYYDDVSAIVDSRCDDIPREQRRVVGDPISDYQYCSIRAIARFLRKGYVWQFSRISNDSIHSSLYSLYSFDGDLIGGHIVFYERGERQSINEFDYRDQ